MKFFTKIFCLSLSGLLVAFLHIDAQVSFTNSNSQLQGETHSGCPVTVVDVNGDGLDDIVRLDQGHRVYVDYQRPGQQFDHILVGDFGYASGWAWSMCVADADHNGFKDVVAGGGGPAVKLLLIDSTGTGGTIVALPYSNFFLQNLNFMDVNNDGWEDIFGCDDNDESHIWVNDGTGSFSESGIIDFDVTNTDDSGNYGSVWTDFDNDGDVDLYIAKCRQGVNDPGDGRRIDVLFVNDGNNNYTSDAAAYGLADSGETWTCNFADIDNDGDLDVIQIDQDVPANLLENDGTGHMTNITTGSGFDVSDIYPIESVMEDFDNDGFVDILVTGSDYSFFHNNGDHTFTKLTGLFDNTNVESFAIGDLDHNGQIDVYASYAHIYTTPSNVADVYWKNTTGNGNHFITFNLIGTTSTDGAYGARVTLYGSWGTQVREVHAGESYGTCNSTNLHFGLGAAATIDSAIVRWPSGITTSIISPAIDQFITVKENTCVSPDFTVSADGPLVFCPGQSVTLTASDLPAGYSYLWSDSSTSQSLSVSATGEYYVTAVSENDACTTTAAATIVVVNPDETPTITVEGDLSFCEGGSVLLTSSTASSYNWSNGDNTQSILATEPGPYTVTIQGTCQSWTSDPINVTVLTSPAPLTTDAYLGAPGQATVTAVGDTISWYDVPAGGSPIATGNSYTTYVSVTDTFYAQDQKTYSGDSLYTGQTYHEGTLYSSSWTTNYGIIFDVFNPCKLRSVKVYTDVPGNRLIELRNSGGNTIQSAMVYVPDDSGRVILDFDLTPGVGYELGTNAAQNNILLGTDGPRLRRSDEGFNYPYVLDSLVSLNGYSDGSDRYYYFYDWEVLEIPVICISARSPAVVYIITGIQDAGASAAFELFPNPTEGQVTIKSDEVIAGKVSMQVVDVTGKELVSRIEGDMKQSREIQLDLSMLPKGIYFLNIESGANTMQHKVVIQ